MIRYGLQILTPRPSDPTKDGWEPVMENPQARKTFETAEALFRFVDQLQAVQPQLQIRVEEIDDRLRGNFRRLGD